MGQAAGVLVEADETASEVSGFGDEPSLAEKLATSLKDSSITPTQLAQMLAGPLAEPVRVESMRRLIAKWLRGRNRPGADYAARLSEIFHQPYGYFSSHPSTALSGETSAEEDALELVRQASEYVNVGNAAEFVFPIERERIADLVPNFNSAAILMDQVTELTPGERIVATQTFREEVWNTAYWYKGSTMVPGILLIEALAQAGAFALLMLPQNRNRVALCAGFNNGRFKRVVLAGEVLQLECSITAARGAIAHATAIATVGKDKALAVKAELILAIS